MEFLNVVSAGIAAFAVGAVWYMALSKQWMQASGVAVGDDGNPANSSDPLPYVTGLIGAIVCAGMMRHVFELSDVNTLGKGLMSGLGIGLFIVTPWIATHYMFSGRSRRLILIDGGYATLGCAAIGIVLTLF